MIPRPCIFQEDWWLDICAGDTWRRETIDVKHGQLSFTYAYRKKFHVISEVGRPPLSIFLGVSYDGDEQGLSQSERQNILADGVPRLLEKLPPFIRFKMNMHPDFSWWSPFYWEGYEQTTKYTYRILNIKDMDSVWQGFNSNAKRNIKKAGKSLTVRKGNEAGLLYDLNMKTMINQGKRTGYGKSLLIDLCDAIYARGKGEILVAEDAQGRAHSALLVVWHNGEAYYLVGGTDPELRSSGAMALTMWEAIQTASGHADVFDFEGSMQKGIDKFIRNFGATPFAYSQIYKSVF